MYLSFSDLNVDPNEDGYIDTPKQNTCLDGYAVTAAALGSTHSLLLTSSGLLSFGNNEQSQLGRSGDPTKPGKVNLLQPVS